MRIGECAFVAAEEQVTHGEEDRTGEDEGADSTNHGPNVTPRAARPKQSEKLKGAPIRSLL